MSHCEDFPCCGHYDNGDPSQSYCPDSSGRFPKITLPRCRCGMIVDPEEGCDCMYDRYDDDDDYEEFDDYPADNEDDQYEENNIYEG